MIYTSKQAAHARKSHLNPFNSSLSLRMCWRIVFLYRLTARRRRRPDLYSLAYVYLPFRPQMS